MKRAAIYLRVSTTRQADGELSLPDQKRQCLAFVDQHGFEPAAEFVDAGASATDDKRPSFQRMIDEATSAKRPFDVIVVHSFSRFFRDSYGSEFYRRKLEKAGVGIVSITQPVTDDPSGQLIRQVVSVFDEYQSRENAKHVSRAMIENAKQGFWNGAKPPYGYRTKIAEMRGDKAKKVLEINPDEAETVRLIFKLYTYGSGEAGPLGVKAVCNYLNERGRTYGNDRKFSVQMISKTLNRRTYIGEHVFNRTCSRTRMVKSQSEWIKVPVPSIIEPALFDTAQARLVRNNPKVTPPRVVNSPTLLTGIAKCGKCGSLMRLRTGKSGRYRYYTCSAKADVGKTACTGTSVSMPKLDSAVISELEHRIFQPERLTEMLQGLTQRNAGLTATIEADLKLLRSDKRQFDKRLDNLYDAIETGTMKADQRFVDRIDGLKSALEAQKRKIRTKEQALQSTGFSITPKSVDVFASAMRERLHGKNPQFRKAYVHHFIQEIVVEKDRATLKGSKLAIMAAASLKDQSKMVPSFEQEWCTGKDSNPRPPDS